MSDTTMAFYYLVVESEPYLTACRDWQTRRLTAFNAALEFANHLGATGIFPGFDNELIGITPISPIPEGWKLRKINHRRAQQLIPSNNVAKAAVAALPIAPKNKELRKLLKHPCTVSYNHPEQHISGFADLGGFRPVKLDRIGDDLILRAPDPHPYIDKLRRQYPGVVICTGEWNPPAGLRPISWARYELLIAQARVAVEEKVA